MIPLDQIAKELKDQPSKPPVHLWNPALCGDIDIVIEANGDWYHQGEKIEREALVKLFASILRREEDSEYYLVTPVEKWRVVVKETPLLIIDMDINQSGTEQQSIIFTDNMGDCYLLGDDYPLEIQLDSQTEQPKPYLYINNDLIAKLTRAVFYRLVEAAEFESSSEQLHIISDGITFNLGSVS
jgi:hypothetical protein